MKAQLFITEIYASVQGESSYAGIPCTFVRVTGCPLRCRWCDTVYSFEGKTAMSLDEIVQKVEELGMPLVELTGGEPLAQADTPQLVKMLHERGHKILIETSGAEPIAAVSPYAHIVMDLKCPDSRMADRNRWQNLDDLKTTDEIKFVLASRADFDWALTMIREHNLMERFNVLLSCAFGLLAPKDLVEWMVAEKLNCRLNLQQHKYIWNPRTRGV